MTIAHRLHSRGALFSHECYSGHFAENGGMKTFGNDDVLIPVRDYFQEIGTPIVGRFISGNTGAVWRESGGIPVLPQDALMTLVRSI